MISLKRYLAAAFLVFLSAGPSLSHAESGLVPSDVALRFGLERAWFSQVRVDPAQHEVATWTLDRNELFAITTDGTVQAMDAETGAIRWVSEVASRNASTAGMAVNADVVAVLSATRLHFLDRRDGRLLSYRVLGGAPSASPALSNRIAYVALHSGRLEGYEIDSPYASVWQYQSSGRCYLSPTATGRVVSWPTTGGLLYVASAESKQPLFRVRTNGEIVSPPTEKQPYLYVASLGGHFYCFHELTGREMWRYSTGYAVIHKPAIVGEVAFVASEEPALHAVDAVRGTKKWSVKGIDHFAALSEHFAYGLDRIGTFYIMDREAGSIAGTIPTSLDMKPIVNDQSDRVYLVNKRGLVQCFHEIGADEPTWHRDLQEEEGEQGSDEEENPFASDDAASTPVETEADVSPFETEEVEEDPEEDNPFLFD